MKAIFTMSRKAILATSLLLTGVLSSEAQGTYQLVTSSAQLVAGGKYLVTDGKTNGAVSAIGYQNTNNRPAVTVTCSSNTITTTAATADTDENSAYEITLGTGSANGTFTLSDAVNGTFLRPRTGNNNGLVANSNPENFTITVTTAGVATVTAPSSSYARNILRYNASADLFACYNSGQDNIYMFKLMVPTITPSKTSLSGFSYGEGSGPSAAQTFTLSASELTPAAGNITFSIPAGFEFSFNGSTYFSNNQTAAYSANTLSARTVYVRMKSGLDADNYSGNFTISGGGTSRTIPLSGTVTNVPLPVTIKDIKAFKEQNGHRIVWTVADEKAIKLYELEASKDAINFETVGTVAAAGTEAYSISRSQVWQGANYYRLNIREADGTHQYSRVIMLAEATTQEEMTVYPNPCTDRLYVNNITAGATFELWDLQGRLIQKGQTPDKAMVLEMKALPAGTYILIINAADKSKRKMILKK